MPRSSRRDFLKGKSAVNAAASALDALAGPPDEANSPHSALLDMPGGDSYLLRLARRAMACEFEVVLNAGQYPAGSAAAIAALDLVDRLEQQMTVYRDDSEISLLNCAAADAPIEVEPRLFALLQQAVQLYHDTGHAYDITSGPLSKIWGFYRRAGRVPDAEELSAALALVGSDQVLLNAEVRTVQFKQPSIELNLGSIGKGYALDRAAEVMQNFEVRNFLLHGGQSSICAAGSRGRATEMRGPTTEDGQAPQAGWWIGLRHPLRPRQRLAEVRVHDRALATSGSGVQFFVQNGRRFGHILDPRTGWPAEGTLSTTVLASTAAEADALSTALYVLDRADALAYCETRPNIGLVLITPTARGQGIQITIVNIAAEDIRWYGSASETGDAEIVFVKN